MFILGEIEIFVAKCAEFDYKDIFDLSLRLVIELSVCINLSKPFLYLSVIKLSTTSASQINVHLKLDFFFK